MAVSLLNRRQMLIQSAGAALAVAGCPVLTEVRADPAWVSSTLRRKEAPNSA